MKTMISASILSADFGNLRDELKRAQDCGCDMIHFDVMDGHFVPNMAFRCLNPSRNIHLCRSTFT